MELETVNKLYDRSCRRLPRQDGARTGTGRPTHIRPSHCPARRRGNSWDRFDATVARAGVGSLRPRCSGAAERRLTTSITGPLQRVRLMRQLGAGGER